MIGNVEESLLAPKGDSILGDKKASQEEELQTQLNAVAYENLLGQMAYGKL